MRADLDVDEPEMPCPFRKQCAGYIAMKLANPLRSYMNVFRCLLYNGFYGLGDGDGNDFGDLRIGLPPLRSLEIAG